MTVPSLVSSALARAGRAVRGRVARVLLAVTLVLAAWAAVRRYALRPPIPAPDAATLEHARRSRIVRDVWGVPHVFGERDQDAAFALAYAHAEDDWPTIQGVLAAARGKLGLLVLAKIAIANDYYTALVGVADEVEQGYDALPVDVRAVLEAYARGLNHYAFHHPREVDTRLLPFRGKDIAAGFLHKLPLMLGLPKVIEALRSDAPPRLGEPVLAAASGPRDAFPGSNAHAVSAKKSADGVARLNVNSHQPWEGPVAWYEAHVTSDEGWSMTGGTFPGAPFILHGHNASRWAHTVNTPDLIDVYELQRNPDAPNQVRIDGVFRPLEVHPARLEIDTGLFTLKIQRDMLFSLHGPVIAGDRGAYAFRYAGIGRGLRAIEQWFRMNKARSFSEWKAAMNVQGIPMFNTVYADRANVFFVYNALLPVRMEGFDYRRVLPGDRSDLVFRDYLPFSALPSALNPASGFVQSCNATPFQATVGDDNPASKGFSETLGIEKHMTNRARRSLELLGKAETISRDDFLRMKWDRTYDARSKMFTLAVRPLLAGFSPATEGERRALDLLRGWNGVADEGSTGASLAVLTYKALDPDMRGEGDPHLADPAAAFRAAVAYLERSFGRVDVALGDLQRLRRGAADLPVGGGPDLMNATYSKRKSGRLLGTQGDSYVLIVDFRKEGVRSESIHQYGASSRTTSPHFADQAPLFVGRRLKPTFRDPAELRANTESAYRPGEERR